MPFRTPPPDCSRREFLGACAVAGAALAGCATGLGGRPRSNVLLILADDLGTEALGCYGGESYKTSYIDGLAATGLRFTDCYCTPLCTPSRVQLMTGQYPFRTGYTDDIAKLPSERQYLDPSLGSFARVLRDAGYATAVAGKWQLARFDVHPDHAREVGFDEHCLWTWQYGGEVPSRYWKPWIWQDGKLRDDVRRADVFGPDVYTEFLIDFMRRNRERPFFAYYPMALPHPPFVRTPRGRGSGNRFGVMVEYMDELVGRLVAALDEMALREDTLVLFTSDNGSPRYVSSVRDGELVSGGKGKMNDRGTRVPLIAHQPGAAPRAAVCEDLVDLSDFLPTLAQIAGVKAPAGLDGRSFAPQLRGKGGDRREWVYIQLGDQRAVRASRFKLYTDGRLYDLARDPDERRPVAQDAGDDDTRRARNDLERALTALVQSA